MTHIKFNILIAAFAIVPLFSKRPLIIILSKQRKTPNILSAYLVVNSSITFDYKGIVFSFLVLALPR
jgi:hypothetical protein